MDRANPTMLLSLLAALAAAPTAAGASRPAPAPRAPAQGASDLRSAKAQFKFDEGRRLASLGRFADACASFIESERLDHGVGTLLNLADCYEKNGQPARAWAAFRVAAEAASAEAQPDRENIAREREIALLPQLAHLTIQPPELGLPPGTVVHRDGVLVSPWLWNSPVPVDPGDHTVVVEAPGKIDYSTTVHVPRHPAMTVVARIPALLNRPRPPLTAPSAAALSPPPPLHPRAKVGLTLLGLGSAGVAVGAILGVRALGLNGESAAHCNVNRCDHEGTQLRHDARGAGNAASVAFIAASATLAGGLVLYATAPEHRGMTASFGLSGGTARVTMGTTW